MEWWKRLRKRWEDEGLSILSLFPAVITAAVLLTGIAKVLELPSKVGQLILQNTTDPTGRVSNDAIAKLAISTGVTVVMTGTALFAVAFALVWVAYVAKYREARAELKQQREKFAAVSNAVEANKAAAEAFRTDLQLTIDAERQSARAQMAAMQDFLDDTAQDAEQIKRLLRTINVLEVLADNTILTVERDGTAVIETTRRIRARGGPVYFVAIDTIGGQPLTSFRDIQFSADWVDAEPQERIAWLPVVNQRALKSVFVFFLPGVVAGRAVTYRYIYRWPGTFKPLVDGASDYYEFTTVFPVPVTHLTFRIAKEIPRLSVVHAFGGKHTIDREPNMELDFRVYRHSVHELQPAETVRFTFDNR